MSLLGQIEKDVLLVFRDWGENLKYVSEAGNEQMFFGAIILGTSTVDDNHHSGIEKRKLATCIFKTTEVKIQERGHIFRDSEITGKEEWSIGEVRVYGPGVAIADIQELIRVRVGNI